MKLTVISPILALLACVSANAAVEVTTVPVDPWVVLADLQQNPGTGSELKAKGPYFEAAFNIKNDFKEPIEVVRIEFEATSTEGKRVKQVVPVGGKTLGPEEMLPLESVFVESLPDSQSLVYKVSGKLIYKKSGEENSRDFQFATRDLFSPQTAPASQN
jgi:hypothetical protein